MLCEKCKKNEASVFYRENINGKERKYSLCPECAAELEKNGEIKFSAFPHLSDMNDFAPFGDFGSLNSIFGSLFSPESRRSGTSLRQKGASDARNATTPSRTSLKRRSAIFIRTQSIPDALRRSSAASST